MSKIGRIEGFGTRRNLSGTEVVNLQERAQSCRLIVYADQGGSAVTFTKGDALALEYRTGSGKQILKDGVATDALSEFGFSNVALQLSTSDHLEDFACGIITETVTVAAGDYAIVDVQVAGKFENANVGGSVAAADVLTASGVAGQLAATAGDQMAQMKLAIALEDDTANKADIYLLDPFNLAE
jgi:hypothetical protein|tara:strand:+ start:715 stop:1266 length:552 start_codon:yes stop_codon:yes gene_type:complete